jgi:predicted outer membrane repeat protein
LHAQNASKVDITNSSVSSNTAQGNGGGLSATDTVSVVVAEGSSVSSNTAAGMGGGLAALGNATVALTGGSSVQGNTSKKGGGAFAADSAKMAITNNSGVHSNVAAWWWVAG